MCLSRLKKCKDCGEIKDLSAFYQQKRMQNGYLNSCKDCCNAYTRQHRKDKQFYFVMYENARKNLPHRLELNKKVSHLYRQQNPLRYKATNKVNNALRDGKLSKLPCFCCGNLKVVAHHVAYDLPLDVVWLCQRHHKELHANVPM